MKDGKVDLWGGIELPEWNRDRFFSLFCQVRQKRANRFEEDEFARLMMQLIKVHVDSYGWRRSLYAARKELDEVAAEVLAFLARKVRVINLRSPCPLVLVDTLNIAVGNYLKSYLRGDKRPSRIMTENEPEDAPQRADHRHSTPAINGLARALVDAEKTVASPRTHVRKAYRWMVRNLLKGKTLQPLDRMPKGVRDRMTADEFLVTVYRTNCVVADYAADLN